MILVGRIFSGSPDDMLFLSTLAYMSFTHTVLLKVLLGLWAFLDFATVAPFELVREHHEHTTCLFRHEVNNNQKKVGHGDVQRSVLTTQSAHCFADTMVNSPFLWAPRIIRTRKPIVLLCIAILVLLILVPLNLHSNVSTIFRDTANELSEFSDTHNWHMPPFPGLSHYKPAATGTRVPPQLHEDPSLTSRCGGNTVPVYDANGVRRPIVQYAIMMDAGSTGSRIHVYKFNYCQASPELEYEHFHHVEPGLSSYGADSTLAADSLRPLLDKALEIIPPSLQHCTPIQLKATAGLRLLGPEQSGAIIRAVRRLLESSYPFPIADGLNNEGIRSTNGVEIMDGRDEGVFAWITVNYLMNLIGAGEKKKTAAVLDLGGGSTQIVFEPQLHPTSPMHPGDHVYELKNFENSSFTLYQKSYLGYGLKQARQSTNSITTFLHFMTNPNAAQLVDDVSAWDKFSSETTSIPSPCYAAGMRKTAKVSFGKSKSAEVTMVGTSGGFRACQRLVEVMMDKDAECHTSPCSFAGVYQPLMSHVFKGADIVALSYFYDRIAPLGLGPTFTIRELERLAERACSMPSEWPLFKSPAFSPEALSELHQRADYCLDLTYMYTLLRLGYELDDSRKITLAKKLGNFELGWALGAQLAVLQQGVLCKTM